MSLWPNSPWPAEDGGPRRTQLLDGTPGLGIRPGEGLSTVASRDAFATTMVVLRDPGEVFVLRHTLGRNPLGDPSVAWVERIDPHTLAPLHRSPDLEAGPFWPGGIAAHANGSLHVTFGRWCHRLSAELEVLASHELATARPHNSFAVLADGALAMKDLDRDLRDPATLTLLDPDRLEPLCESVALPEPAIARLSADDNAVYVVGITTAYRYLWDGRRLERDPDFEVRYLDRPGQSYGWDPVIEGGQMWFLDNGAHDYSTTMRGAGASPGPVHLVRVPLHDSGEPELVEVCGEPRGAVTNPPLYEPRRRIAIGYDSANGVVSAFRFGERLEPLWQRRLDHSAHMVCHPDTGELVLNDFVGPAFNRTRAGRVVGRRLSAAVRSDAVRAAAARRGGDDVVVVDIETGAERGRARVPSIFQSVVFPAPGWSRDLYWCTFSTLARVAVT